MEEIPTASLDENTENLYNIEKSTYSDKDSQIKKYILDLLEKNKEIIRNSEKL